MSVKHELRLEQIRLAQQLTGSVPYETMVSKVSELINSVNYLSTKVKQLEGKGAPNPQQQPTQPQPVNGYLPPVQSPNAPVVTNPQGQAAQASSDGSFQVYTP